MKKPLKTTVNPLLAININKQVPIISVLIQITSNFFNRFLLILTTFDYFYYQNIMLWLLQSITHIYVQLFIVKVIINGDYSSLHAIIDSVLLSYIQKYLFIVPQNSAQSIKCRFWMLMCCEMVIKTLSATGTRMQIESGIRRFEWNESHGNQGIFLHKGRFNWFYFSFF